MQWGTEVEIQENDRRRRVTVLSAGESVSYAQVIDRWQDDADFRDFFIGVLADAPFEAFLWETPPITEATTGRAFEFVLVDCPSIARPTPDTAAFAEHFAGAEAESGAVSFWNLGRDARLVVPTPLGSPASYPHVAVFARTAPTSQQHALWAEVGRAVAESLSERPLWLSTCGLGVAWLHVRLDSRPKYYRYGPYRSEM